MYQITAAANLANWSSHDWSDGIEIDKINELQTIAVETLNSLYEITILSGRTGEVLVRGGQYFPDWAPAILSGASFGGSFLKCRGIYIGVKDGIRSRRQSRRHQPGMAHRFPKTQGRELE
jgi:hypothetical protein